MRPPAGHTGTAFRHTKEATRWLYRNSVPAYKRGHPLALPEQRSGVQKRSPASHAGAAFRRTKEATH
ncbi:MAG: hypothetical protein IT262_12215 [Saprospiraceae bacterium]|nr:hypothetical protein [Saprospiraceae bacterium]